MTTGAWHKRSKRKCYTANMKKMIYLGVFVGSTIGSGIGSLFDHGNFFGWWGFLLGTIGAFVGIWAGYKISL